MGISAELLPDASVNVSWESFTLSGIVYYTIYYRPIETMGNQIDQSVTVPSSESSVVIEDLMADVEYLFEVVAIAELEGHLFPGERSLNDTLLVVLPTTMPTTPPSNPTPLTMSQTPSLVTVQTTSHTTVQTQSKPILLRSLSPSYCLPLLQIHIMQEIYPSLWF